MVGETAHNGRWRDLPKYKHLATVEGTFVASHKMRYWGNLRKGGKPEFDIPLTKKAFFDSQTLAIFPCIYFSADVCIL